jgi:uncharacterized membrane protein
MPERSPLAHLGVLAGVTLVLAGAILTAAQVFGMRLVFLGWPLLVIIPGALLLLAALSVPAGKGGAYLAIPGSIVLVTGAILQVQSVTGDWQSWAYAWALVVPTSLGVGLLMAGAREKARGVRTAGAILLGVGAALFVIAEWFFVRIIGVGGPGLGWWFGLAFPALLVALGVYAFVRGLIGSRR